MKNELTELTSKRLREALNEADMSAQALSNASGVGKSSISQYVNGSHAPSNIAAYKMGKVLGVRAEWLMGLDDKKKEATEYVAGTIELIDLFAKVKPEQRQAVLNLLRSFVSDQE